MNDDNLSSDNDHPQLVEMQNGKCVDELNDADLSSDNDHPKLVEMQNCDCRFCHCVFETNGNHMSHQDICVGWHWTLQWSFNVNVHIHQDSATFAGSCTLPFCDARDDKHHHDALSL